MQPMGIDVSKENFHVFVILEDGSAKRSFPNNASGFKQLLKWLDHRELSCVHACMEATGGFGDELATALYDAGHRVSIVTPKRIKSFGESEGLRTKTDAVDAALIARYCASQQPAAWEPPSLAERALQALVRRRDNLLEMRTQEKNRVQAARTTGLVQKSIEQHLRYLDESIAAIEAEINDHVNGDPKLREKRDLLTSIPGIADTTANAILAEMPDIEHFRNAKAVGAFAGLSPRERQSGKWSGRTRICKVGNARLRKACYFPAVVGMRCNPVLHAFALRLEARGKCKMVIITAVMRKLLIIAYGVLKSGRPFSAQPAA